MRLHRFYIEESLSGKREIRIEDDKLLHQLRDVFRLKAARLSSPAGSDNGGQGDEVIFFDGRGIDYKCKVGVLAKREGVFEKISEERSFVPSMQVTLLMSVIKKENFELAVEKATEIGVSAIVPIITERTLSKNLNAERLQRIMIEASEQCGRGDIASLGETLDLAVALDNFPDVIAFDISGERLEAGQLASLQACQLLVGPEGGWSEKELAILKEKNITIAKLGDTTLRAETATIVACAKVLGI